MHSPPKKKKKAKLNAVLLSIPRVFPKKTTLPWGSLVDSKEDFFLMSGYAVVPFLFLQDKKQYQEETTCNKEIYFLLHTNMSAGFL